MKVKAGGIHEERVIRKIVGSGDYTFIIRSVADHSVVVKFKDTRRRHDFFDADNEIRYDIEFDIDGFSLVRFYL